MRHAQLDACRSDTYQTNLAPSWILRGLLAWLLISPKAELVGFNCAGALKVTRLVVLNDSNGSVAKPLGGESRSGEHLE